MIPQQQLTKLKPIPDQVKRSLAIKRKQNRHNTKKFHLTRRARQNAEYPLMHQKQGYKGPQGKRWKGTPKKENRKKKK